MQFRAVQSACLLPYCSPPVLPNASPPTSGVPQIGRPPGPETRSVGHEPWAKRRGLRHEQAFGCAVPASCHGVPCAGCFGLLQPGQIPAIERDPIRVVDLWGDRAVARAIVKPDVAGIRTVDHRQVVVAASLVRQRDRAVSASSRSSSSCVSSTRRRTASA